MKIISRGVGEQIVVDDHITVTVLKIDKEKLVLSIASLKNSPPYREVTISLENGEPIPSLLAMTR